MSSRSAILIAGGGPAGCIAAAGLSALGHDVRLITRPSRRGAVEGLSERVLRALENSGFRNALAAIGPQVQRQASWSGAASAANREWVVARDAFDAALLVDVRRLGVAVHEGRVTRAERMPEGWRITTAAGQRHEGCYLIEARGRQAPGRRRRGPRTTALGRRFEGTPPIARTAVAPFRDGWAWYASVGDGSGVLVLIVSTAQAPLPKRADLVGFFERLLTTIPEARAWLGEARSSGKLLARHAEPSRAIMPIGDGVIRIGDAALAMDPLSGHGVFEAIASARAAVAVVNTILRRPQDAPLAAEFYRERVEVTFMRVARIGRDFYAQETRWPKAPFWSERRIWPDSEAAHASMSATLPRIAEKPVIEGDFIIRRPVVVTADQPRGVWQVDGVSLVDLLRCWEKQRHEMGEANPETLARRIGRAPEQIATALAWLRHRRMIG